MANTKDLENKKEFVFGRENYKYLILGLILLMAGFLLMAGGGSDDPDVFSYSLFNFQRLVLSPLLIIAGFVVEFFAIMKRPNK